MADGVKKINENIMKDGRTIVLTTYNDASKYEPGTLYLNPQTGLLNFVKIDDTSKKNWSKFNPNVIFDKGTILSSLIGDGQVLTTNIATSAVTTNKIAKSNITNELLAKDCISQDKIQIDSIITNKIKDRNITHKKIALNTITKDELATGCVTRDAIKAESVDGSCIAKGCISKTHIASRTITNNHIELKCINQNLLADNCIENRMLNPRCIIGDNIGLGQIGEGHLKDGCITSNKISSLSINTSHINKIDASKLIDASIKEAKIASNQITNRLLSNDCISYEKLNTSLKDLINRSIRVDNSKAIDSITYSKTAWINGSLVIKSAGSETGSFLKLFGNANITGDLQAKKVYNAVFADLSEAYIAPPNEELEEGDAVALSLDGNLKIEKLTNLNSNRFLGFVSNSFATIYGASLKEIKNKKKIPICLIGRIKIKISGNPKIGNYIYVDNGQILFSEIRTINSIGRVLENKSYNEVKVLCQIWP